MARPRARIPAAATEATDDLTAQVLARRRRAAEHAADDATAFGAVRAQTAYLLASGVSASAIAHHLRGAGVCGITEATVRSWAAAADRPAADPPSWWQILDHRPPVDLADLVARTIGQTVDPHEPPVLRLALTTAQAEALRQALGPQAQITAVDQLTN